MQWDHLTRNWALVAAAVIGIAVTVFVLARALQDSPRGRLRARNGELRRQRAILRRAANTSARAETSLESLRARSESVPPRRLQQAADALADARALEKIAQDQVLIAENQLRKLIVEEFPPKRQETLRRRYRVDTAPERKPFTF